LEYSKLAKVMQKKGLKILKNVNTRWISMIAPTKRVWYEYKPLLVKMVEDVATVDNAKANYELLCNVETLLGLPHVLPLLGCVQTLSNFAQSYQVFICDFIAIAKICHQNLFKLYCDPNHNTPMIILVHF
jgi:hypothetical protein